jgi:hypothetical protein
VLALYDGEVKVFDDMAGNRCQILAFVFSQLGILILSSILYFRA